MPLGQAEIVQALDAWAGRRVVLVALTTDLEWPNRPYGGVLERVPLEPTPTADAPVLYRVLTEPRDARLVNPEGTGVSIHPFATGEWLRRDGRVAGVSVAYHGLRLVDIWLEPTRWRDRIRRMLRRA